MPIGRIGIISARWWLEMSITTTATTRRSPIRLGYVPLNDAAPVLVAAEQGYFSRHGVDVRLSRELGWGAIRDKLAWGELDAAHAPCALPFQLRTWLRTPASEAVASVVLSLNGNAITLSESLWKEGVRDVFSLSQHLRSHRHTSLTFGVASTSTHSFLLRQWLRSGGINPDTEVQLVVVPPPQMAANLRDGHLNGFCSGEPWNSVAVVAGNGWVVSTSSDLERRHPEKVLAVGGEFTRHRRAEVVALTAALLDACTFCSDAANRDGVVALLARREYLNLPAAIIRTGWPGEFDLGHGQRVRLPEFNVFSGDGANEPSADKAAWVVQNLLPPDARHNFPPLELGRVFRHDLYHEAQTLALSVSSHPKSNKKVHESLSQKQLATV